MRLQLFQRPLGDAKILHKGARVFPSVPLRDIGRNRDRSPPDLRCHSKRFLPREATREQVTGLGQRQGVLPHPQVAVRNNFSIAQRPSLFALPYSLFATRYSPLFTAFSSTGSKYTGPSQADRKSKLRNSCARRTG